MLDANDAPSTRPYLIRGLYEWCTDNGFTPFIVVKVDQNVRVPSEFVRNGEIVLNISFAATSALKLGNDYIEFKGRFSGVARDILVPIDRVLAIYARENGQGMTFPVLSNATSGAEAVASAPLTIARSDSPPDPSKPEGPRPRGGRPALTRVK
ncbi:MAG: ClpXP protease specificity-enhancing factor [Rhodoferax sp.]|nr:ClpXP protease specificity-enhancing factor [Rhodoferax sp.]